MILIYNIQHSKLLQNEPSDISLITKITSGLTKIKLIFCPTKFKVNIKGQTELRYESLQHEAHQTNLTITDEFKRHKINSMNL